MEDRYLFKAKRIDNGEWVEGHYITNEKDPNHAYIGYLFGVVDGMVHDTDIVEVIPSTICQCTGLKYKNGKLIWENDIVNAVSSNSVGEPICVDGIVVNVTDYNLMLNLYYSDELECVGNKFDNPDLLESEE